MSTTTTTKAAAAELRDRRNSGRDDRQTRLGAALEAARLLAMRQRNHGAIQCWAGRSPEFNADLTKVCSVFGEPTSLDSDHDVLPNSLTLGALMLGELVAKADEALSAKGPT